ncbi:MAG: histone H1 [Chryseobacterium sp.]|nr:MAG: histone H1 [Chryseobacterium sp.]
MENYNQFKALISSMDKDAVKFFTKGNASAGTRLRKNLHRVKMVAHGLRKQVSRMKSNGEHS